jgi:cyclase
MSDPLFRYKRGLVDLGDGCYAWLEPPGSWGLANSGIVVGADQALVIDTQNDMRLARDLLEGVNTVAAGAPVTTVINTHGDSDHWAGNVLFHGARIISSEAALGEMTHMWLDPADLTRRAHGEDPFGRWVRWRTKAFDYRGWRPVYPTETFTGEMTLEAAGQTMSLIEVGPAHTNGDLIVALPSVGILYAADVVFVDSTPMVWAGPISRCIAACDLILDLEPRIVVPGHGPVVGQDGVREMRDYLRFVQDYATAQFDRGKTPQEAYGDITLGPYAAWAHASRVYQTIRLVYDELDPGGYPSTRLDSLEVVLAGDDGEWTACAAGVEPA